MDEFDTKMAERDEEFRKAMAKNDQEQKNFLNRLDKAIQENTEEHEKILEELHAINNILTKLETEHENKINILFDAYQNNCDHLK